MYEINNVTTIWKLVLCVLIWGPVIDFLHCMMSPVGSGGISQIIKWGRGTHSCHTGSFSKLVKPIHSKAAKSKLI